LCDHLGKRYLVENHIISTLICFSVCRWCRENHNDSKVGEEMYEHNLFSFLPLPCSFGFGLAELGYKTCVIDFDIGLRNLDIHLVVSIAHDFLIRAHRYTYYWQGCERRVIFDFVNVINDECALNQVGIGVFVPSIDFCVHLKALIKDKRLDNLYLLAASQTKYKTALTEVTCTQ
jgi:hypothetical protein